MSSHLYRLANEAKNTSEMLELTLKARDKDLEALSIIWEAAIKDKQAVAKLKTSWEKSLREFETKVLNACP